MYLIREISKSILGEECSVRKAGKWFVTKPYSRDEITDTRGSSKGEAQEEFLIRQSMLTGLHKPWIWWEKQGYRVRRG